MSKLEKFVKDTTEPAITAEEDTKIKEFVRKEYLREAEMIEQELSDEEDLVEVPSDMYDRILRKLEENGTAFEKESTTADNQSHSKAVSMPRLARAGKWAAIFCLVFLGVFGVSMSSEANRAYIMEQVNSLIGKEVDVKVNNDEDRDTYDTTEEEAVARIEEELMVEVPNFSYKPAGMQFEEAEILPETNIATLVYALENKAIILYIATSEEDAARTFGLDGELVENIKNKYQGIDIAISALQSEGQEAVLYNAQWSYKNNYYVLNAMMDLEEFQKILSNMFY